MPEFWLYFRIGLTHVLNLGGYDHVMFLMALTVPYTFKDWRNVLVLATLFTVGHTISLILAVYGVVHIDSTFVEFLIPITILITALYNIIKWSKKAAKDSNINFIALTTLFFGVIHGLGFSNYFKIIIGGTDSKLAPLLEFAMGIEAAQLAVVFTVLVLSFILQGFFKVQRRDWLLVTSAFVAGVVVPMIIESEIW
ncbi:HupE/UreJ family protein [Flavobacterium zepuense]|uniref:HupE/UreJ family protein n=1 Tax=Flavobacterium zepuense TaxID=2593302 RepID=A0A552UVY7_9FLAO|nr:HupE/UreJ family protein [Flavobacterium zepuense]TRW22379.1 HupE/UreJ family protein [Flavobacterium zepuense]